MYSRKAQVKQTYTHDRTENTKVDEYGFEDNSGDTVRQVSVKEDSSRDTRSEYNDNRYSSDDRTDRNNYPRVSEAPVEEKFYQKGIASWYGREFQGKVTASGERFDMNEFTAAHRELPFGTIADIKDLKNRSTVRSK
jgi:rare lipoprotein A (peptidoglycan hydrolase)